MRKKLKEMKDGFIEAISDNKEELITATAMTGILLTVTYTVITPFMIIWKKLGLYNQKGDK